MKKKIWSWILSVSIITSVVVIPITTQASMQTKNIIVEFNGQELLFDVSPQIVNGRTMVPMRTIFEAFGAEVSWEEKEQLIIAIKDYLTIFFVIDYPYMGVSYYENEEKTIPLDSAPMLQEDRTLIPLRAVADAFNAEVQWIDDESKVVIREIYLPSTDIAIENYRYSYEKQGYYIESVIPSRIDLLRVSLSEILGNKDVPVKQIYVLPDSNFGYMLIIDTFPSAKNEFFSLYLWDEIKSTIFSVNEVSKYRILIDGNDTWDDGHHDYNMGEWQMR